MPIPSAVEDKHKERRSRCFVDPRARHAPHHGLRGDMDLGKNTVCGLDRFELARGAVTAAAGLPVCHTRHVVYWLAGSRLVGHWFNTHYCTKLCPEAQCSSVFVMMKADSCRMHVSCFFDRDFVAIGVLHSFKVDRDAIEKISSAVATVSETPLRCHPGTSA